MIANNRKELLLYADSTPNDEYPISLYPSSVSMIEIDTLIEHYNGSFENISTDELCNTRTRAIYLMNRFAEEVGSAIRNTSVSYAYKKIRRAKEIEKLLKEYNATAANTIADGHIKEELEVYAEREAIQELMKLKFGVYKEFIHDITQQISLRRKELDMGVAQ